MEGGGGGVRGGGRAEVSRESQCLFLMFLSSWSELVSMVTPVASECRYTQNQSAF